MAFKIGRIRTPDGAFYLKQTQVKDGVTLTYGEAVKVVNGVLDKAATNGKVAGVVIAPASVLGADAAPVLAQWAPAEWYDFYVPQGALADNACDPGDTVDLATDALSITTDSNHDLEVITFENARSRALVRFLNPQLVA